MTREEARGLVQRFMKRRGLESPGLNANGLGGVGVSDVDLYFEHREDAGTLKCSALLYRFRGPAKSQVVDGFRRLEKAKALETGGARIDFEPESRGIYLARLYTALVPDAEFDTELQRLGEASIAWRTDGARRVADMLAGF